MRLFKKFTFEWAREHVPDNQEFSDLWDFLDDTVLPNNPYNDTGEAGGLPIELRQFIDHPTVDGKINQNPILAWKTVKN